MDRHDPSRESGNELDWESFWNQEQMAIREGVAQMLQPIFDQQPDRFTETAKLEKIDKKMEQEKEFSKVLLFRMKTLLDKGKPVLALFDIDETIGSVYLDKEMRTVIRPSFLAILERVKPLTQQGKINIGLLTTRGNLEQQLKNPDRLEVISKYVNPNHLYSTGKREYSEADSRSLMDMIIEDEGNVVKQGTPEEDYYQFSNTGSLVKVIILGEVKRQNPDTIILAVDDDRYPPFLDENKGVSGLKIDSATRFSLGS